MRFKIIIILLMCGSAAAETALIHAFNTGEVTGKLEARADVEKYYSGCREMENFYCKPWGGATKRPGTYYIASIMDYQPERTPDIPGYYKYTYISNISGYIYGFPLDQEGSITMGGLDASGVARDAGGGLVGLPMAGHPYAEGDTIRVYGTTNYDDVSGFAVESQTTANEIVITETYNAETFDGTEIVFKDISGLGASSGRMAMTTDGTLYYGTNWNATYDNCITKIEPDGTKVFDAFDFAGEEYTTYTVVGLKITPDDQYLYVMINRIVGLVFKFNIAAGTIVWGPEIVSSPGYDLELDSDNNCYVRGGDYIIKYSASDGSDTTMTDMGRTAYQSSIIDALEYDLAVDLDAGIVVAGGSMYCSNSKSDEIKAAMYNLAVRTFDDSKGDTYLVGDNYVTESNLYRTQVIGVHRIAVLDGYIYVNIAGEKIRKLKWDGSSISFIAEVAAPDYSSSLFFDLYGNLICINSRSNIANTDRFYYYDTDLNYLGKVDIPYNMLAGWNAYVWTVGNEAIYGSPAIPGDTIDNVLTDFTTGDDPRRLISFDQPDDTDIVIALGNESICFFRDE